MSADTRHMDRPPGRAGTATGEVRVRVWDRFVRVFHWSLVLCFFTAYFSTVGGPRWLHEVSGYAALGLVTARIVWGFVGTGHARFASFVPRPATFIGYAGAMLRGREPRHLGHNPAAALMILFLLAMVIAIGTTGWMMTTDAWWGNETVETVHALLVDATLLAVAVHVSAAVYESVKHRENLVWSMVTGTKRAPDDRDDQGLM
jgi:cytochrome b